MNNLKQLSFLIAGGDCRQNFLAKRLAACGQKVCTIGLSDNYSDTGCTAVDSLDRIPSAPDVIVLPLIASSDGETINAPFSDKVISVRELCGISKSDGLIVGGKLSQKLCSLLREHGAEYEDYFMREELIIKNCIPTAEGALQIAMENTPVTINGSSVLITGFGRVARASARLFDAVGAKVTVAARRREALAEAYTLGYQTESIEDLALDPMNYDVIINTVPAVVLDRDILSGVKPDSLIIDLASKPGGVDFNACTELGLKVIWALSLPGKTAPVTSGCIIADTIMNICRERGLFHE